MSLIAPLVHPAWHRTETLVLGATESKQHRDAVCCNKQQQEQKQQQLCNKDSTQCTFNLYATHNMSLQLTDCVVSASKSSVLTVDTVVVSYPIMRAVEQVQLSSSAEEVVQQDWSSSLPKWSTCQRNGS